MSISEINNILKIAKKRIKNPNVIIDPYDLTFVWVNKKFYELTGYSESDIVDKQIFFGANQNQEEVWDLESKMISQTTIQFKEVILKKKF